MSIRIVQLEINVMDEGKQEVLIYVKSKHP